MSPELLSLIEFFILAFGAGTAWANLRSQQKLIRNDQRTMCSAMERLANKMKEPGVSQIMQEMKSGDRH